MEIYYYKKLIINSINFKIKKKNNYLHILSIIYIYMYIYIYFSLFLHSPFLILFIKIYIE